MEVSELYNKITECLFSEYHSVWVVDVETEHMMIFKSDMNKTIPGSVETAKNMLYTEAARWYALNCVSDFDKKHFMETSTLKNIVEKLQQVQTFSLEFTRANFGVYNYNQIVFTRFDIDHSSNKVNQFLMGFRDIDIRRKMERDELTDVYTRQVFFQKANALILENPGETFDVIISDVVDFKSINEKYGIELGDKVLKTVGIILNSYIKDDVVVGRYGGDQFVVIRKSKTPDIREINDFVSRLNQLLEKNCLPHIDIKFGQYIGCIYATTLISSCDKARMALNSIKHKYDTIIAFFDDKLEKVIETNRNIESSMRQSLIDNCFHVYYQPKHDATSGKLIGAEALIRWKHPEYGLMSPSDFIPVFEKTGFIVEADYFVWRKTCENMKKWKEQGLNIVPVSVNSSKLTFQREDMEQYLQSLIQNNQLEPEQLPIEITESMMTEDTDFLKEKLERMREKGFKIELDDFGSGYSSINLLSAFPLDAIKLDMSFMRQFGDEKRAKVLSACIKLAKELGYRTVSEGVEKANQLETLIEYGVDAIQGYIFSKPLPETEFEEYLKKNL